MWLDSKAVNCPQKWGNFTNFPAFHLDCSPFVGQPFKSLNTAGA